MSEEMADELDEFEAEAEDETPEGVDDVFPDIYVETATNMLYEVHMFDTFVLARIASPNQYAGVRKLTHVEFSGEFHEYGGDPQAVKDYLRNAAPDFILGE